MQTYNYSSRDPFCKRLYKFQTIPTLAMTIRWIAPIWRLASRIISHVEASLLIKLKTNANGNTPGIPIKDLTRKPELKVDAESQCFRA
ncbi:MAG TPA: hypothetical protein PJ991_07480, partial [Kiritimatiellia bacterium]|nr:hypothetical protein [Kiritimatiellia bacterium]